MSVIRKWSGVTAAVLCCLVLGSVEGMPRARAQAATSAAPQAKERARIVLSEPLPTLDGDHLQATLVVVNYGPGEASSPHSHACPVIGYVAEGAIRSQVQGQPERTYKTGESFYEAPHGVHLVSANASLTEPAKLLAYFICDHDAPLSSDAPKDAGRGGAQ